MNNYIDYDYYKETFKGDLIPQEEFEKYATRSSNKVRNRIFNRDISLFEFEVKNATCSVADILYNQYLNQENIRNMTNGSHKVITSEKVGDWSKNYSNVTINDLEKISSNEYVDNLIEEELQNYLFVTGLLYTGVAYVR